jgi:DUF4097 and DUF4098 domain-containing protein YvlB
MKHRAMIHGVLGLAALLALAGCGPTKEATREQVATFDVGEFAELEIVSSNGRVEVRGVDGQTTVEVTATLRSRAGTLAQAMILVAQIEVEMTQDGDRVVLAYRANEHPLDVRLHSGVDFDVTVPATADAEIETSNGRVAIERFAGILSIDTSNAWITVSETIAEITASTSNGRIDIERSEGIFVVETSNAAIRMESLVGIVDAATSNGRIDFAGSLLPGADHRMLTSNGRIDVAVPPSLSLRFDARTSGGTITSPLPLVGDTDGREWDAVLNPPATGTVTLQTSNGNIEIHGLPE